jgi:hypothetical protein
MRISKDAPAAVRIAKLGEDAVGSLLKQEVNLWDKFNMSHIDLALEPEKRTGVKRTVNRSNAQRAAANRGEHDLTLLSRGAT